MTDILNTLDKWEAEAFITHVSNPEMQLAAERILTLIDLIRKKDEAFRYYKEHGAMNWQTKLPAIEALALTENLLEKSKP